MKICTYVLTADSGLAPNPFGTHCTLAVCTPNHRGARLDKGDWIVGFYSRARGGGLIYAMRIAEKLHFDDYYRDPRFEDKKPIRSGNWRERVGDNMYFRDEGGRWVQHSTDNHAHPDSITKDTQNPYVFVADEFYYFGRNRPTNRLPEPADKLEKYWQMRAVAQGLKYFRQSEYREVCHAFIDWLRKHGSKFTCEQPLDAPTEEKVPHNTTRRC